MNPSRRPRSAGNWKMNAGGQDACPLAAAVAKATRELGRAEVLVAPPFTAIAAVAHELSEAKSEVAIAAQNMHDQPSGAFTGNTSPLTATLEPNTIASALRPKNARP